MKQLTTELLGEALVRHGVIDEAAVTDPDGYDGGRTRDALALAACDLSEPSPRLAPEHVEALRGLDWFLAEDYDGGCITTAYRDAIERYRAALAALGEV